MFDAAVGHMRSLQAQSKPRHRRRVDARRARAAADAAGRARASTTSRKVESFAEALALPAGYTALAVLGLEQGFETPDLAVIGEQDILGDRLVRPRRKRRRPPTSSPRRPASSVGDFVVHADHGIGRFDGLTTITALGAPHDCLEIAYAGGDKLYLPVENIELLSRYGSAEGDGAARPARRRRLADRARPASSSACARSPPS